jgi:hypothetical protein
MRPLIFAPKNLTAKNQYAFEPSELNQNRINDWTVYKNQSIIFP